MPTSEWWSMLMPTRWPTSLEESIYYSHLGNLGNDDPVPKKYEWNRILPRTKQWRESWFQCKKYTDMIIIAPDNDITYKNMLDAYYWTQFCFAFNFIITRGGFTNTILLCIQFCHQWRCLYRYCISFDFVDYRCLLGYGFALHFLSSSLEVLAQVMLHLCCHSQCLCCINPI